MMNNHHGDDNDGHSVKAMVFLILMVDVNVMMVPSMLMWWWRRWAMELTIKSVMMVAMFVV